MTALCLSSGVLWASAYTDAGEWMLHRVWEGGKHLLIAGPNPENFRDGLRSRWPQEFERVRLTAARPQRDEFRIRGARYAATLAFGIDLWPLVEGESVLLDEVLTWSFGPILFTYRDETSPLVKQVRNLISETTHHITVSPPVAAEGPSSPERPGWLSSCLNRFRSLPLLGPRRSSSKSSSPPS